MLVQHEDDLAPELLLTFLSDPGRVDAIFALNWVCAVAVLRALGSLNKKVLEDYPLISFNDFELADMIPPGLTVVRQPSHKLGTEAAKALFERIDESERRPFQKIVLETEFIVRGSCGCKPRICE